MTDNSAARGEIMQNNWESKRDWILFRERIAGWQEAYIGRLNREYIELLSRDGSEAEKFWELYKRIRRDKRCTGLQDEMRSSEILANLCRLVNEGAIGYDDLDGFSEKLREDVIRITSYNAHGSEKFGGNCDEDKTTDGCYFMSVCSCNVVMNLSGCRSCWRSP